MSAAGAAPLRLPPPKAARKSTPGYPPVGQQECCNCGAKGFERDDKNGQVLCEPHAIEVRARREQLERLRRQQAEREEEQRRARQVKRDAAAQAAADKARAAAAAHAALVAAAAAESEESEGGAAEPANKRRRVASKRPHALARKTLRVQYALRNGAPSAIVQHLLDTASGDDEAAVQALATLLPPSLFPPEVRRWTGCACSYSWSMLSAFTLAFARSQRSCKRVRVAASHSTLPTPSTALAGSSTSSMTGMGTGFMASQSAVRCVGSASGAARITMWMTGTCSRRSASTACTPLLIGAWVTLNEAVRPAVPCADAQCGLCFPQEGQGVSPGRG